uniref:Probable plastid-lipid-associated protein 8, chloroplastic n=1 Tax=Elaeis guineensis var. tenera TaxID=51953 RepID=A0A8N4F701_ELAGV|nr:probable plastid-lipid-associated protein 8, chloroplastic [Elaeis guineensis]
MKGFEDAHIVKEKFRGDIQMDCIVKGTDGGVLLTKDGHKEVADVALQLEKYCVDEPVKCPLIFGEWDVVYCSRPTSPGGGYRSAFGRLVFKTNEMVQVVEAPDTVRNMVSFSAFGFLDGEVSLKGKLKVLDDKWIQVIFLPPKLKIGSLGFQYGGESEVKLQITYIDEKLRLGKGSRGTDPNVLHDAMDIVKQLTFLDMLSYGLYHAA